MTSNISPIIIETDGGTEVMRVDPAGNVGIGTASPNNQLVNTAQASFGGNTSNTGSEPIEVQGPGAGVSFYDRTGGSTGRWVIYSDRSGGAGTETLRFWSAGDKVAIDQGGNVGIGTTTPGHPLDVNGNEGIRQNRLYMSGGDGWSSLSYNAYHNDANNNWVFPDQSRPAVTIEMDDNNGSPRFQVWSTTPGNPTGWIERFAIDGNTGNTWVGGDLSFVGNLFGKHGDATNTWYDWLYALNSTITVDVNFGVSRQVFALIVLPGVRGGSQSFSALAYIDSVDGQPLGGPGDPAHASWRGTAQTIRFGLSTSAIEAWALAIVFIQ